MYILGISAYFHDSAAVIIYNGEIIAAAQEERFTRIKHDAGFPANAIRYCLEEAKINPEQIENIVFYEKPFSKFERLLETYFAFAPRGFKSFAASMPLWLKEKLFLKKTLLKSLSKCLKSEENLTRKLLFSDHHLSHAASAFYPSPFENAAVLIMDGVGEWATTSVFKGSGKNLKIIKDINFPHSLGLLYSAFTYYIGFKVNSGEYKVMGLAPYGEPKYIEIIKNNLIDIFDDGSFRINMKYFDYATGLKMTNHKFNKLFGGPPRNIGEQITQKEMDIAASIQKITEEIVIKISKNIFKETRMRNLCIAGGVALNCVINGILLREKIFENIWIQPASGDAGGALGASLALWHIHFSKDRKKNTKRDTMKGSFLGPKFTNDQIKKELEECGAVYKKLSTSEIIEKTTDSLINKDAIGWMQGRMEFGPRALGARSIIADPRSETMQKNLNLKVKFRESFRPFAPSILNEEASNWFDHETESPYMLFTAFIKKEKRKKIDSGKADLFGIDKINIVRSSVPAITHVDFSARLQTVHKETSPLYHNLLSNFYKKTGCPILVNTSFNVRGEPIVCSPTDAYKCFMGTNLDLLVIGDYLLIKKEQNKSILSSYKNKYELD